MVGRVWRWFQHLRIEYRLFKLEHRNATHYERLATYVHLLHQLKPDAPRHRRLRSLDVESTVADAAVLLDLCTSMRLSYEVDGVLNYSQTGISSVVGTASGYRWLVESTHSRGLSVDEFFIKFLGALEALLLEIQSLVETQPHYVERKLSPLERGTRSLVELLVAL